MQPSSSPILLLPRNSRSHTSTGREKKSIKQTAYLCRGVKREYFCFANPIPEFRAKTFAIISKYARIDRASNRTLGKPTSVALAISRDLFIISGFIFANAISLWIRDKAEVHHVREISTPIYRREQTTRLTRKKGYRR